MKPTDTVTKYEDISNRSGAVKRNARSNAPDKGSEHRTSVPDQQEWNSETAKVVTLDSTFEGLIGLSAVSVDDELVLIDYLADRYYRLNGTGAILWKTIIAGRPLKDVAQEVQRIYRLSSEKSTQVVLDFARELSVSGLIVHLDQPRT